MRERGEGMKIEKNRVIRTHLAAVSLLVLLLLTVLPDDSFSMGSMKVPTVTVVDEETGQPIEGVVAIAIWRKHSILQRAFWEGGAMVVAKMEEAVSDKDGNIFIDGFWGWYSMPYRYPRLTIYKPGYICWDQVNIFKDGKRTDFDEEHRIARIAKWKEGLSYVDHDGFVGYCTNDDYLKAPQRLFNKALEYETPFRIRERDQSEASIKWRKAIEEDRKRYLEEKKRREGQ